MNTIKKRMNENTTTYYITVYLIIDDKEEIEYHRHSKEPNRVDAARFICFLKQYYKHNGIDVKLVAFEITCNEETVLDRAVL